MGVPILTLNVNNEKIVVKQDIQPVIITGATNLSFTQSGATVITENKTGNNREVVIYTPIVDISNLVDNDTFTGHTGNASIHFPMSGITITESQVQGLVGKYSLSGHTHPQYMTSGDTTSLINNALLPYMTSGDTTSLINDALLPYWNSGETQNAIDGAISGLTTYTFTQSGSTVITETQVGNVKNINIYTTPPTGTTVTWNDVTDKPNLTLQSDFTGHTSDSSIHFTQAEISITESQISDLQDYALQSNLTGLTETVSNHTGDTSIHYVMSTITITENQISDLKDYALQSDFTGHTSDSSIHFTQAEISITESQINDLKDYALQTDLTGLTQTVNTHTGDTSIHFTQAEISITESQISDLQDYALESDFTGHTSDSTIHFTQAEISITESQISDLKTYALESDLANYLPLTGGTVTGKVYGTSLDLSGDLKVDGTMNIVHTEEIYSEKDFMFTRSGNTQSLGVGQISGIGILNADGSGTTVVLGSDKNGVMRVGWSGDTLVALAGREDNPTNGYFAKWDSATSKFIGHDLVSDLNAKANVTDFQSHTGDTAIHYPMSAITVTESQVSNLKDYALQSDLTGLTQTVSTHTGDTTIHFTQAEISITESQISDLQNYALQSELTGYTTINDFDTFTGTTLPADYYNKTEVDGLISGFTTPYTFVESGATQITQLGQTITIYSPTGGTGSSDWNDITNKPDWITSATVSAAELNVLDGIPATLTATELGYCDGVTSAIQTQIDAKAALNKTIVSLSTNTVIDATYAGKIIEASGTITITLPNSMSTGMLVDIINVGTGVITIAASTTLQSAGTKIATQYTGASCYHRGSNVWIAAGRLTT